MSDPLGRVLRVLAELRAHGARAALVGTLAAELVGAPSRHREIELLLDAGGDAEVERLGLALRRLGLAVVARTEDPRRGRIASLLLAGREPGSTALPLRLSVAGNDAERALVAAATPRTLEEGGSLPVVARGHLVALAARAELAADADDAPLEALLRVSTPADLEQAREALGALDPALAPGFDALLRTRGPRWSR